MISYFCAVMAQWYSNGLENRQVLTGRVGSNPTHRVWGAGSIGTAAVLKIARSETA